MTKDYNYFYGVYAGVKYEIILRQKIRIAGIDPAYLISIFLFKVYIYLFNLFYII